MSRRVVIASVVAAVALSGCGSSKKSTSTTTTNAASKLDPAFIARVNAVCAGATKRAHRFPFQNFNPTKPDVKLLPKVGAFFAKGQAIADAVPNQLRDLGTPATGEATWAQMLALTTRYRAIADRQIKAAKAADVHGFVATLGPVKQTADELAALAREAGFSSGSPCSMIF